MNFDSRSRVIPSEENDRDFFHTLSQSEDTMTASNDGFTGWGSIMADVDPSMFASHLDLLNVPVIWESMHSDFNYDLDRYRTMTPDTEPPLSSTENHVHTSTPYHRRYDNQYSLSSTSSAAHNMGFLTQAPPVRHPNITNTNETGKPYATSDTLRYGPVIKCHWKGCRYNGTFGRSTELKRHVETQHISPNAFRCSFLGCSKSYNREDNLKSHSKRVHDSRV
ncbi:hypothetical protein N7478_011854 [Penicillium angulare]|uniref:uncharacterized protein n=1 Tax=Penicillium angulare TaxID=116970 RepID=UPI00253F96FE|nr:uncharacterized protein N7478_011854 [Penicillium angulare]KAJ5261259.1 hypothetical protein N7478_011854 [Penicillium angulare]